MKILHVSSHDIGSGAAHAARRLHRCLRGNGINSWFLCQQQQSEDHYTVGSQRLYAKILARFRPYLERLPLSFCRHRQNSVFHLQWLPGEVLTSIARQDPEIVHLHWICDGFVRIEALAKIQRPIVWTLHDMWAFTGGCHYSAECDAYKFSCGSCPQLGSQSEYDFSRWTWKRKKKSWQQLNLTIVTPSRWLATCAGKSGLFRNVPVRHIFYPLDLQQYHFNRRQCARDLLHLPKGKKIILFGALSATSDLRKGFHLLVPALQKLKEHFVADQMDVVVFGASEPRNPPDFGFKVHYLGRLHDNISLSLVYAACDVFVAPSLEDNLPLTIMESLACGTPCAAFDIGGISDLIEHQHNGYLARPLDTDDLARGIAWILETGNRWQMLSRNSRKKAETMFDQQKVADMYTDLYQEILNR